MSTISIIVPIYGVEAYLSRCLDSILSQTFTDFDLILVDDGSLDNCGNICDEYAVRDGRVHVIHQKKMGVAAARNSGIDWMLSNSNAEYVSFVDSDDWVHAKYLELLLIGMRDFSADIAQCSYVITGEKIPFYSIGKKMFCISPNEQYVDWYNPFFWGKLFKKDLFNRIRFPEGQIYEDVMIWYKVLFSHERITIVDEPLYYYFQRSDSITSSEWTPAKFAQIKAWDAQLQFAVKHGNQPVLKAVLDHYFYVYKQQSIAINRSTRISSADRKKYKLKLQKKQWHILRLFRNELLENKLYFRMLLWALPYGDNAAVFFGKVNKLIAKKNKHV